MKRVFDIINFFSSGRTYQVLESYGNKEISTNYVMNGNYVVNEIRLNRKEANVDNIFSHNIALYVIRNNEDHELKSIQDYRQDIDCLNKMMQLLRN
ncbi:hypothetical protein QL285_027964 [Trifolium repens]|nr:hypothetical protein QL285_027964 [Trifolium repens]